MFAASGAAAGAAGLAVVGGAVDGAEAGGGEGDEEPGVVAYGRRDRLAADKAGADKVEGISRVEAGAGRADGGAAVAAA